MMTQMSQLAIIPALLVTLAGLLMLHNPDKEKAQRRFLLFLLVMAALMLLVVAISNIPVTELGAPLAHVPPILLAPAALGTLALILLNLKWLRGMSRKMRIFTGLLALVVVSLLALSWNPQFGIAYLLLPGTLLLVVGWPLARRYRWLAISLALLCLGTLIFWTYTFGNPPDYTADPPSLTLRFLRLTSIFFFALPGLAVIAAAVLLTSAVRPAGSTSEDSARNYSLLGRLFTGVLALGLILCLAYTIFWGSVWDQTSDGLAGIFISLPAGATAIAAGMIMMTALRGKYRLSGLLFMVFIPLLLYQSLERGWQASYHEMTETRAARIAGALDQYQAREGHYPETLDELRPRDMLFIQQPVILAGEKWCYQGGADYYRLAAFHREFFSSPVSLRLYESDGQPPAGSWECEERTAEMKERYYSPMEDPAAFQPPPPTPLPDNEVGVPKSVVQPLLDGVTVNVGSWSPDSAYFVFWADTDAGNLHFLDGRTGEVCTAGELYPYEGDPWSHHAWLPDGRLLYLDTAGEMLVLTPCRPEVEELTGRFPVTFTQIEVRPRENGRLLLRSEDSYWILDGRTFDLYPVSEVTPVPYELHWDNFAWLPASDWLAIARLDGRANTDAGSTLFLVDGNSGRVAQTVPLPGTNNQSAPWMEGLSEHELLLHYQGDLLIMDFSTAPPGRTSVFNDIFNLDVDYPNEVSASGSFLDPEGNGYYLAVRLNHPRNQAIYLYHSATGDVHVYEHENHTLLIFPDGELVAMEHQETVPDYQDEYDVILASAPAEEQPRLSFTGHTPREYPHLSIQFLPATSQILVSSEQGVSLVSWPAGELLTYWELPGAGYAPWIILSPDNATFVVAKGSGALYGPLPGAGE